MKIMLQTADDLIFLAGDGRVSPRVFSPVADFSLEGDLEKQIVRRVRGAYGKAIARGNVTHRAFFRTRRQFPTAREAEEFVAAAERSFPREGTLYFVTGAGTRKLRDAVVTPPLSTVRGCEASLQYQATGSDLTPLEPDLVIDGIEQIYYRIVEHLDEKWFEVGFDSPYLLDGNATDGWMDPDGHFLIRFYRSENLTAWDNDWIACPTSPETITGGYRYWGRSKYPVDSKIKTGQIEASSGDAYGAYMSTPGNIPPDTRNNPFTSLTILGVSRELGGFPYTMPGDAGRMQTDLAAIFPGATVEATDATNWRIRIPNITTSAYAQLNKVFWPGYYVADMFEDMTILIDGANFAGTFVNSNGVRTSVMKQFARLGVSPGPNYLY